MIELCPSLPCLKFAVPTLLSSGTIPKASEFPELGEWGSYNRRSKPSPGMFQPVSTSQVCFPKNLGPAILTHPKPPKDFASRGSATTKVSIMSGRSCRQFPTRAWQSRHSNLPVVLPVAQMDNKLLKQAKNYFRSTQQINP